MTTDSHLHLSIQTAFVLVPTSNFPQTGRLGITICQPKKAGSCPTSVRVLFRFHAISRHIFAKPFLRDFLEAAFLIEFRKGLIDLFSQGRI